MDDPSEQYCLVLRLSVPSYCEDPDIIDGPPRLVDEHQQNNFAAGLKYQATLHGYQRLVAYALPRLVESSLRQLLQRRLSAPRGQKSRQGLASPTLPRQLSASLIMTEHMPRSARKDKMKRTR